MPDAFALGPLLVRGVPLVLLAGVALALWLVGPLAARLSVSAGTQRRVLEAGLLAGLLGSRTMHVLFSWPIYRESPWSALYFWQAGHEPLYGAALGAALVFALLRTRPQAERGRSLAVLAAASVGGATLGVMLFATMAALAPRPLAAGHRLPEFALVDLAGRPVGPGALAGRATVFNLWATWCLPCRREMPLLQAFAAAQAPGGLRVVGVNVGEAPDTVRRFVADNGVGYAVWLDPPGVAGSPSRVLLQDLGGIGLPTTWFIAADGRLAGVYTGELTRAVLEEWRQRLDGGR